MTLLFPDAYTILEIVSCESRRDGLERIFRRWSHELFLVKQSVLLFSCNSTQVTRGRRQKFDFVATECARSDSRQR